MQKLLTIEISEDKREYFIYEHDDAGDPTLLSIYAVEPGISVERVVDRLEDFLGDYEDELLAEDGYGD